MIREEMEILGAVRLKEVEKAQQDVSKALNELQQAPPGLMEQLQKERAEIQVIEAPARFISSV